MDNPQNNIFKVMVFLGLAVVVGYFIGFGHKSGQQGAVVTSTSSTPAVGEIVGGPTTQYWCSGTGVNEDGSTYDVNLNLDIPNSWFQNGMPDHFYMLSADFVGLNCYSGGIAGAYHPSSSSGDILGLSVIKTILENTKSNPQVLNTSLTKQYSCMNDTGITDVTSFNFGGTTFPQKFTVHTPSGNWTCANPVTPPPTIKK